MASLDMWHERVFLVKYFVHFSVVKCYWSLMNCKLGSGIYCLPCSSRRLGKVKIRRTNSNEAVTKKGHNNKLQIFIKNQVYFSLHHK